MRFFTFSSFSSLGGLEAVAGAAHSLQVARILGVGLDFFANAAHVDIDGARGHIGSIAPDRVEKMVTAEDASLVAREIVEQAELGGSGRNQVSAHGEGHRRGIDFDVADFHGTGRQGTLEAAQHGLHARNEFAGAKRLSDVVVRAEFEAEDAIGFAAFRGQKNYGYGGQAGSLSDGAANLQAVLSGDHDVEDEECGPLAFGVGEDIRAGGINANREAFVFQVMADQAGNVGIVFNDEDAWFHGDIVAGKRLSVASCRLPRAGSGAIFMGL